MKESDKKIDDSEGRNRRKKGEKRKKRKSERKERRGKCLLTGQLKKGTKREKEGKKVGKCEKRR